MSSMAQTSHVSGTVREKSLIMSAMSAATKLMPMATRLLSASLMEKGSSRDTVLPAEPSIVL